MKKSAFGKTFVISAATVGALLLLLNWNSIATMFGSTSQKSLLVYCAAGISKPVKQTAQDYEKEFGTKIEFVFGGSGSLLSQIRAADNGDLYLAASKGYFVDARKYELIDEVVPIAHQRVAITVPKGNPQNIQSLQDLLRDDVRVCLANPEVAAISRAARTLLEGTTAVGPSGSEGAIWELMWNSERHVERSTVNDVANDVKLGAADAGIVWDATAGQYPELDVIRVPVFEKAPKQIAVSVLKSTGNATRALHFMRYLTAKNKGLKHFEETGYDVVAGDDWADRPELVAFIGGVNRPAVEKIIEEFQLREGVDVLPTYNGCGVLVAQIKGQQIPDIYHACDTSFMVEVAEQFPDSEDVSHTDMVLIAAKDNPHQIKDIRDLAREELRVGLCNPEKSALGKLSQDLLKKDEHGNIWQQVYDRCANQPATADVLATQVGVGALDIAIVYRANTTYHKEKLTIITIDDKDAIAVQPIAVHPESRYRETALRLKAKILSAESKQSFVDNGFKWLGL